MHAPRRDLAVRVATALAVCLVTAETASAQATPGVPEEYRKFFVHYADNRSLAEKALNAINFTSNDVGRSFALIAGVSDYAMKGPDKNLRAAAEDLRKLQEYLKKYEFFDEIVVLKDKQVSTENFEFFLQNYFPDRLKKFPKSRFLFAYSGHGITEGSAGYFLKSTATSFDDRGNAINLAVVRAFMDDVVRNGHQVLVMINSCHSGSFLKRSFGSPPSSLPRFPGAHAITSGGSRELSWAVPKIGAGSVFFEKFFAGLDGRADMIPKDGIVTAYELAAYLYDEVQSATDQQQSPQFADLSINQSKGQFFFLNRERMVDLRIVPEWKPEEASPMGIAIDDALAQGTDSYRKGEYATAVQKFDSAARAGNTQAMVWLGYMYGNGLGVPRDDFISADWYRRAADLGDLDGYYNMGVLYRDGLGVERNPKVALDWFRKAAERGNTGAMTNLAAMLRDGIGTPADDVTALGWFQKGANAADSQAMSNLAWMYENGRGIPQNYAEAAKWYEKAAALNDAYGIYRLGLLYERGLGQTRDYQRAASLYQRSALAGNSDAMIQIGYMYEKGWGVPKDDLVAIGWYEKAANAGNPNGMYHFGTALRDGLSGAPDHVRAVEWLRRATDKNFTNAFVSLGWQYQNGLGVPRDYVIARDLYARAASEKNALAMANIGSLYENGLGVQKDLHTAYDWYRRSHEQGNPAARESMNRLEKSGVNR